MDFSIEDIDLELDHLLEPTKRDQQPKSSFSSLSVPTSPISKITLDNPKLILRPESSSCSNSSNDDLFQITNRDYHEGFDINKELEQLNKNHKLNKLMEQFENDLDNDNWELDDQGRTRIFKGRFKHNINNNDELDHQLNQYLNSNKENINHIRPSKDGNSIANPDKLTKLSHNIPKLISKTTKSDKLHYNFQKPFKLTKPLTGVCKPNHKQKIDLKPSINYRSHRQIFLVDSSTGLLNDATQFGTELNASNCEGFPLPEDINEVVQIPTNDDDENNKMAIIKTFNNKFFSTHDIHQFHKTGFYSKLQYDNYYQNLPTVDSGVQVVNQSQNKPLNVIPNLQKTTKKSVKFADSDKLEW